MTRQNFARWWWPFVAREPEAQAMGRRRAAEVVELTATEIIPLCPQLVSIKGRLGCAIRITTSAPRFHLGIRQPQRLALFVGDDLAEGLAKIEVEILPFGPAEMGHAERIRHS
jgi:hypothetical protein